MNPCIKCTEMLWHRACENITYRIWVHSLPHSGDLRMHEHSDEPFANLVQWNKTCKYKENIVNMEWPSNMFGKMPNHWASGATGMSKIGLDGEPHAETTFLSQSFEHSENDSWQFHYGRKTYKQNKMTSTDRHHCMLLLNPTQLIAGVHTKAVVWEFGTHTCWSGST